MLCFRHKWNGCTCIKCGKTRDEGHLYEWIPGPSFCREVCSICGDSRRSRDHEWKWIQSECVEKCTVCGKTREKHSFAQAEGRPCTRKCTVCGKEVTEHRRKGCTCTVCGDVLGWGHDWEWISEGDYVGIKRCKICGKRDESGKMTREQAEIKRTEMYQNMDEGIR